MHLRDGLGGDTGSRGADPARATSILVEEPPQEEAEF